MKTLLLLFPLVIIMSFTVSDSTLTKQERKFANDHLKQTQKELLKTIDGLSATQLAFKPDSVKWSVEECMKHIAMTEIALWKTIQENLAQKPNPEKRTEIKMTDEQLVQVIQDRSSKRQTFEALLPHNTPFKSAAEASNSFTENRNKLLAYIDTTQEDMRSHVINFPVGMLDAYQLVLLISAHSNRHTQQIKEVMANPAFPK